MANNHLNDFGSIGIKDTIVALKERGIDFVGAGENSVEAAKVLLKEIDGETIGIINCCENEFSIATNDTAGSNPLNPVAQYNQIKKH